MSSGIEIILVDDDQALRRATRQTLELAGYAVRDFGAAPQALAQLSRESEAVVVADIRMAGMDGLELFARIRSLDPDLPVLLITGHGDVDMAVRALHDGAYDFIAKPFPAERLVQSVARATEKRRLVLENRRLREAATTMPDDLPLIGQTPAMEHLRQTLRQIADTDVDVLIAGETGSGKEVVATLLHRWSRRTKGNFVALNCGALPETVIESELFGHEAGAFTGAQKKRVGRIEHASGGTLFLDEIESMPLSTQVKMLRVLEMREVSPLGTNEVRPVDLRVVAAAKLDLGNPAERGEFRIADFGGAESGHGTASGADHCLDGGGRQFATENQRADIVAVAIAASNAIDLLRSAALIRRFGLSGGECGAGGGDDSCCEHGHSGDVHHLSPD